MVKYAGERGITKPCVAAFKEALAVKGICYVVLISYSDYDANTQPLSHGFVIVYDMGNVLTVVQDGIASGYGGEGPHGLVDCLRCIPFNMLTLHIKLSHAEANKLFDQQLTRVQILDLLGKVKALKVKWNHKGHGFTYLDLDDSRLYTSADKTPCMMH